MWDGEELNHVRSETAVSTGLVNTAVENKGASPTVALWKADPVDGCMLYGFRRKNLADRLLVPGPGSCTRPQAS